MDTSSDNNASTGSASNTGQNPGQNPGQYHGQNHTQNNGNVTPLPGLDGTSSASARELPNNIQAEQNFLGALLLDNEVMDKHGDMLRAEHFYDPVHGRIFDTCARMIGRGQLANPITLKAFFANDAAFAEDGASAYLNDLVDGVISLSEAGDYAKTIHESYLRRELIRISDKVAVEARQTDLDMPAYNQIEAAEQYLFNLAENDTAETGLLAFGTVLEKTVAMAEKAANSDGHLSGVSTGLTDLNKLLGGLHKSDLLILAGRPGMGKTALATNIAFHAATTTRTG